MNLHAAAEGQAPATSPRPPISWQDGFAALGPDFFTHLRPTPLPEPHWIATSTGTAELLGLDPQWLASDEALQALTGNAVLPGSHPLAAVDAGQRMAADRKSTRLNSSHSQISYAVFCLKKKKSWSEQSPRTRRTTAPYYAA